jgi:hypothetical protein
LKNKVNEDENFAPRRSPRIAQLKIDRFKELAKCKKQTNSNFLSPQKLRFNEKQVKNPAFSCFKTLVPLELSKSNGSKRRSSILTTSRSKSTLKKEIPSRTAKANFNWK